MGGADDHDGALATGAGGGADLAPCGARGVATRAGGRGARLLAHDPPAVRGTGRGDLTRNLVA